ncbi:hypothetical protein CMUS01_02261 [Colletotrichum musicola]|uniref:Uncharacterized protein n=1 Tax=Colletotrichum musicola TaxID=2175873 RepID=A0A8H6NVK6_9PEZI|nr:hypothetical protein CMUS01_02261 [Colletotrichum musicola]
MWSGPARTDTDHGQTDADLQLSLLATLWDPTLLPPCCDRFRWRLPRPSGTACHGSLV